MCVPPFCDICQFNLYTYTFPLHTRVFLYQYIIILQSHTFLLSMSITLRIVTHILLSLLLRISKLWLIVLVAVSSIL